MAATPDGSEGRTIEMLRRQLEAMRAERDEARAQQAALAEVLQAINSAGSDIKPVFDLLADKAIALCGAAGGELVTFDGDIATAVSLRNVRPALVDFWKTPQRIAGTNLELVRRDGKTLQRADMRDVDGYRKRLPLAVAGVELGGIRTFLQVPLRNERGVIGLFMIFRHEVQPFTDRQVALVEAFAAQAVIALENARLIAEQREALEQQTATTEVLEVINASPGSLEPVFGAMIDKAMHLCEASFGMFARYQGSDFEMVADRNVPSSLLEAGRHLPSPPPISGLGRLVNGESVVQFVDLPNTEIYRSGFIGATALVAVGANTAIFVALRKDDVLQGAIIMYRKEKRAFSDKQVALLQNFAAQAVIAMENARLLTEQREALEQQTATADILRVISQSLTDVQPVLDAVARAAVRFCGAADAVIGLREENEFRMVAKDGPLALELGRREPLNRESSMGRSILEGRTCHLPDIAALDPVEWASAQRLAIEFGQRAALAAPMLRDGVAIGSIALRKPEAGPFTPRQVELLEIFAAQAVIAIENVRLFTELKESLEQQTATTDILRVISQSPTDVDPVLRVVAKAAVRFCGAEDAVIQLRDGDHWYAAAHEGSMPTSGGQRQPLTRDAGPGLAMLDRRTVHFPDIRSLDAVEYAGEYRNAERGGFRAALVAPMLRDNVAIGSVGLRRAEPGAFTPRQIELVESFAAQAVIAIENVRLFTELKESLDQQTATSEVLRVISQSPTNVQPALDAVAAAARRFCGAVDASVTLLDGSELVIAAHDGSVAGAVGARDPFDRTSTRGRSIHTGTTVHVADLEALEGEQFALAREIGRRLSFRATISTPLLRDGRAIGCLTLRRPEPGPFTPRQIQLLETFAAQAVIAIENVRLFTELKESLDQQTATADILRVIAQSPTDVAPVLKAVSNAALRFCGAEDVAIDLREGEIWRCVAHAGILKSPEGMTNAIGRKDLPGRAMLDRAVTQIPDVEAAADPETEFDRGVARQVGFRAAVAAPLMRQDEAIGAIILHRTTPGAFSERQIVLLQSFAAQAVIAIENVRLFTELKESLDYQTATSEVLGVISRSPANMQPVLEAMTAAAVRLCGVKTGGLSVRRGNSLEFVALVGQTPEFEHWQTRTSIPVERGIPVGDAVLDRVPVQIVDVMETEAYKAGMEVERAVVELGGHRTILHVPLLREDEAIGLLTVSRSEPQAFTDRQIGLIKTFAEQAVIAMENARLLGELRESLDQQTATAQILQVINTSPGNLTPVFQVILEKAHSTCGADMGSLFTWDGTHVRAVVTLGYDPDIDEILREPHRPIPAMLDLMAGQRIFHRVYERDRASEGPHEFGPRFLAGSRIRTNLIIPLRKDDAVLGFISANRREVRPYSDKEIALLENFAAQAVIAMENARLLGELRHRTDDLAESLEYQTATSELLEVISRSAADIQPVLDTMLASAARLCGVQKGDIAIRQGDVFRHVAFIGPTPEELAWLKSRITTPGRATSAARALMERRVVHVLDQSTDSERVAPGAPTAARTTLAVPLLRDDDVVGVITLLRDRVEAFSERQIKLIETFADQAVIAMENARLLGELTRREEELRVTFDHMGDGVVMFDADLKLASWNRNFQELLDVPDSFLASRPGLEDYVRLLVQRGEVGHQNPDEEIARYRERANEAWSAERRRPDGRIIEVRNNPVPGGGAVLIYADVTERKKAEAEIRAARDAAEAALERQTATADILKVIASSPTDVQPVLDVLAKAAVRFCGATDANIHMRDGNDVILAAHEGPLRVEMHQRVPLNRETGFGAAMLDGSTIHRPDILALDPVEFAAAHRFARELGFRAVLVAPLLREGTAIGAISLRRVETGAFTPQQIELLETFAAQAVIAVENVRLFTELRDSLERLKAAQANLVQSEKMASLGQLTAGIAHEIKNPLNFVNNFATLSVDLLDELKQVAGPALATLDKDKRAELDETMELLTGNLGKIAEHGKRADGIVRSMLSHSRGGSGDWAPSDINALVEEAMNLAYHGARAQDQSFNITLERDFHQDLAPIEVVPQDMMRVFLNLIGNGFYAANKRRMAGKETGFRPTLKVTTRETGDGVEVRVRDNGTGIPPEIRDKLFQPFFTTKPTGEGTGLGLSISYDIVTQQHGGTIDVESEVGRFTEFTVRLPRARRVSNG